jgi:hypothetical protein
VAALAPSASNELVPDLVLAVAELEVQVETPGADKVDHIRTAAAAATAADPVPAHDHCHECHTVAKDATGAFGTPTT